jgi:hypothetical protein
LLPPRQPETKLSAEIRRKFSKKTAKIGFQNLTFTGLLKTFQKSSANNLKNMT